MHAGPGVVREARLEASVRVALRVDGLAVVEVVEQHGGWAGDPAFIGDDVLDVAVGELDLELHEDGELVAVEGAVAAPAQPSAKPTVAERDPEDRSWARTSEVTS